MEFFTRAICAIALLAAAAASTASDWTVKTTESAPPKSVSESICAILGPQAIQVLKDNQVALELWLRKEVPLKSSTASLESMAEATLVGIIAVKSEGLHDYKGNTVPAGEYTARFALQPQDGDHLGTADYDTFLALIPSAADKELTGIARYTPMVKASGKITPSGHPAVISLRPVSDATDPLPAITEPAAAHRAVRLKLSGKTEGGDQIEIPFDLVFEGSSPLH